MADPATHTGTTTALPAFSKILVANRGEIAVRAFRAAFETGASTVAVYPREDRNSFHRSFASEAVRIGTARLPSQGLPRHRRDHPRRGTDRRRRDLPRLRLPVRERHTWPDAAPRTA
jgi:hypothetical protein